MTRPRSALIKITRTPYYHCISRCVRRSYLCGQDSYTGQCFDHRKQWMVDRIKLLGEVFAIDIAAYAVMSNHYHLVLHVNKSLSETWSRMEVVQRWLSIYKGPELARRYLKGELVTQAESHMLDQVAEVWRKRLRNISWFMACLNEFIARRANQEDECKGRFWEGRFVSRGLEDISALLSCMAYVDLNPARAGIADTLENSDFTSIQQRILEHNLEKRRAPGNGGASNTPGPAEHMLSLMPFTDSRRESNGPKHIPFLLTSYIELVEFSLQNIGLDKKAKTPSCPLRALSELNIDAKQWLILSLETHKKSMTMLNGLKIAERAVSQIKRA